MHRFHKSVALLVLIWVTGCGPATLQRDGGTGLKHADLATVPDAVSRPEPPSKTGNPKYYDAFGKRYYVQVSSVGFAQKGIASSYTEKSRNRHTANGERYDMYKMTAAHPTLPIPTYVRVTNLGNDRSVVVRVNDRGPFREHRIIKLSHAAAAKLDMLEKGTALVEVRAIDPGRAGTTPATPGAPAIATQPAAAAAPLAPAAPAKSAPQAGLYIQAGAFANHANAQRLREKLSHSLRPPVHVIEGLRNGDTLFRVRVGPLENEAQVEALQTRMRALGIGRTFTVLEPVSP